MRIHSSVSLLNFQEIILAEQTKKQECTQELKAFISGLHSLNVSPCKPTEFKEMLTEFLREISANMEKKGLDKTIGLLDVAHNPISNRYNKIHHDYSAMFSRYEQITNMIKQLDASEARAHRRALRYRILTTLGIGFSIMIVYWVANYLGIPMPLLRLPV